MISVDVVVVNWNGSAVLGDCLRSLLVSADRSSRAVTITVVDNGSVDDSVVLARAVAPSAAIVRSQVNLGFAGGVALGIDSTTGEAIVLVNNDATVDPDFIERIVDALDRGGPRRGAVTGHIVLAGSEDDRGVPLVNSTGSEVGPTGNGRDRGYLERDDAPPAPPEVFGFCGGAAALRRSALDEVGNFDPTLFLYYEDTELSWRLRRHGYDVGYAHDAVVTHRHAFSSGLDSPVFTFYNTRNRLIVATRHAPARVAYAAWASALVRMARLATNPAGRRTLGPVARGTLGALRALPRDLATRRRLRRTTTLTSAEIRALITR